MRWKLAVGAAAIVLFAAACSSSSSDDGLSIERFDVPSSADCSDGENGTVDVSWDTNEATEVAITVDGDEFIAGAETSGDDTVEVICDGEDYDIELTASDDDGNSISETETVSTEAPTGNSGGGGSTTTTTGSGGGSTTTSTSTTTTTTLPPTPDDSPAPLPPTPSDRLPDSGTSNLPFNPR